MSGSMPISTGLSLFFVCIWGHFVFYAFYTIATSGTHRDFYSVFQVTIEKIIQWKVCKKMRKFISVFSKKWVT